MEWTCLRGTAYRRDGELTQSAGQLQSMSGVGFWVARRVFSS